MEAEKKFISIVTEAFKAYIMKGSRSSLKTDIIHKYIKSEIDHFVKKNNLPSTSYYSISIPASFEANQRKDLKIALDECGIPFQDSLFIDEPNAAFLSYLVEANSNNLQNYNIPVDSPLHILVFDFGAGTCDISILEIGRKAGRLYSKNIAISKFEQLGGDDIDKRIVKEVLFPQLCKQNNLDLEDIKTSEYEKILLPKLQPIAEYLKVQICKCVSRNLIGRELPELAHSNQSLTVDQSFNITLPRHKITYNNPVLKYSEFADIMGKFTSEISDFDFVDDIESLKSIFTVIQSAISKANLPKEHLNLVLLIGGSSYNPYVQTALRKYFNQSEIELPRDLQAHVSTGTAINSFLQNGMNIDMIKPIVSEPVLIILQNNLPRIIVAEGTEIPFYGIEINDLHPQKDDQKEIEIPICVSSKDKILSIIKIQSAQGFSQNDKISLKCDITHDKLIHFRAFIKNIEISVEPINPFANQALSTEDIAEKTLLKSLNEASKNNGGTPPVKLLRELANFYVKLDKHLKAAETFETIQALDPRIREESTICFHYSNAGRKKQSNRWAEIAYHNNDSGTNAYNLALVKEEEGDIENYKLLMEQAIAKKCDAAMLVFGEYLLTRDQVKGKALIEKAFEKWYSEFKNKTLHKNNYSRLVRASRQIGRIEVADEVKKVQLDLQVSNKIHWYNEENLASDSRSSLPEITN
jgi:molecular chaperone DnaK (HSP70)